MIDINLAPPHLKKKKKKGSAALLNLPRETMVGLIGGVIVLLAAIHLFLLGLIFYKYALHKRYQKQWEEILPQKQQTDRIINEMRSLQSRTKSLKNITRDQRITWAPKLNVISDRLPREVWLNRIYFDQGELMIKGSAVSKVKNEMISVSNFVANLKKQKHFTDDLTDIELGSIQRRVVQSLDLVNFLVTAKEK